MTDSLEDYEIECALHESIQERINYNKEKVNSRYTSWTTRGGLKIKICDMDDNHLFNCYKKFGDDKFFREMVYRLFNNKIQKQERKEMTEEKKTLIEKLIDVINAEEEAAAAEIINACLTIVDNLYCDQGAAERDVQGVLKECVQELNKLLPNEKV